MRILAIEPKPTTDRGGSERSYFDVLTGLRERGHDVVLLYEEPGDLLDKYIASGVQVVRTDLPLLMRGGSRRKNFIFLWRAAKVARSRGPFDVIYVNFTEALPLAGLMKLRSGTSIVCHIRIGYFGLTRQILWAGKLVRHFIVINKKLRPVFEKVFKASNRIDVVYNGLTIPESLPVPRTYKAGEVLRVLYLGRIAPEKGVSELVRSFAAATKNGLNATLQITGSYIASHSGDYRSELANVIAESGVSHLITIDPAENNPVEYMNRFDLFVFPVTWDESFGRTVPESILAGTPVLARNVGMIEEIMINNPDFLFDSDEMLTTKLLEFHNGRLKFDFDSARMHVTENFNKKRMVTEVEAILTKVVKKN